MDRILYEIINEANHGKIIIDGDPFLVAFHTIIIENDKEIFNNVTEDYYPTLIIKNKNIFYEKLREYILLFLNSERKIPSFINDLEKNKIKLIITYLFANATTEDLLDPIHLLNKHIEFLNDNTFFYLNDGLDTEQLNYFHNSHIKIQNTMQSIYMETPYRMDFSFMNMMEGKIVEYVLPSISYGIVNKNAEKVCYIYSILHPKITKDQNTMQEIYHKKISREMYRLNAGIIEQESEEYKKGNTSGYDPENISDVSPSAILSLTIFIGLLSKEKISCVKAVPYLPICFLARELSSQIMEDEMKKKEMKQRNIRIQKNITDKFIRTFRRVSYHFSKIKITSFPYEISEYLEINLSSFENHLNQPILEDLYHTTLKSISIQKRK